MMLDHIEIVKAALHIFEVVEGKHPDVRLESYIGEFQKVNYGK